MTSFTLPRPSEWSHEDLHVARPRVLYDQPGAGGPSVFPSNGGGSGPGWTRASRDLGVADSVAEVTVAEAQDLEVDVVILQRPSELDNLATEWLGGRRPGPDIPSVYLAQHATGRHQRHEAPSARPAGSPSRPRHPFQRSLLGCWLDRHYGGRARDRRPRLPIHRRDPSGRDGHQRASTPLRVTGADLIERFRRHVRADLFGMETEEPRRAWEPHSRRAVRGARGAPRIRPSVSMDLSRPGHDRIDASGDA